MWIYQTEIFKAPIHETGSDRTASGQFNKWMLEHQDDVFGVEKVSFKLEGNWTVIFLLYKKNLPEVGNINDMK